MEELFLEIRDCLSAGMPELTLIDEDCGQLDTQGNYPVGFPCALINAATTNWEHYREGMRGTSTLVVKLAIDCTAAPYASGTADSVHARQELADRMVRLLNKHNMSTAFSPLQLQKTRFFSLAGQKKVYECTFGVKVSDSLFAE